MRSMQLTESILLQIISAENYILIRVKDIPAEAFMRVTDASWHKAVLVLKMAQTTQQSMCYLRPNQQAIRFISDRSFLIA